MSNAHDRAPNKGEFRTEIIEHYEACLERGTSIKDNFQYYTLGYAYT